MLSVALSVAFPRLDVIQHPALRCPDFPPALLPAAIRYPQAKLENVNALCKECAAGFFVYLLRFLGIKSE